MAAYYNEIYKDAAQWLRDLIRAGLIADGEVDERSIKDVEPNDVAGFSQCHFFGGIGGWSLALRLSGWPDDKKIWTGSCPCQPFSAAGKQKGSQDDRHLWPDFYRLISQCKPDIIAGEQVESAIRHGWLDLVQADLEREGYAVGHTVLGAHSVTAPHQRQRLYWIANANSIRRNSGSEAGRQETRDRAGVNFGGADDGVPDNFSERYQEQYSQRGISCAADARAARENIERGSRVDTIKPSWMQSWNDPDWIYCRDNNYRPVKPGIKPLAHGLPRSVVQLPPELQRLAGLAGLDWASLKRAKNHRVTALKGYGNSIVVPVAAQFISSFMEVINEKNMPNMLERI